MWAMWYLAIFILGIGCGLVIEQKYDLLKPKHVRKIEEELERLRREIRSLIGRLG